VRDVQRDAITVALEAGESYGFALAGGLALNALGLSDRPSNDGDIFTSDTDPARFASGVDAMVDRLVSQGYDVEVLRRASTFAQVAVTHGDQGPERLDFAVDYRAHPPLKVVGVGLVIALEDAVASKLGALYGRGEVRDYLDVLAILSSQTMTWEQALTLADARSAVPLDRTMLAASLQHGATITDARYAEYGLSPHEADAVRERLHTLADTVTRT